MTKLKIDELQGDAKFLFFTMMQAAIRMKEMGESQKRFIEFAKGIWETMEINGEKDMFDKLQSAMAKDMLDLLKK